MKRLSVLLGVAVVAALFHVVPASATTGPTLWISDDTFSGTSLSRIYQVVDGSVASSFVPPPRAATGPKADSSIAIDPTDGTLWGASEGSPTVPGGVVNYSTAGVKLSSIDETLYGGNGTEGVAVDPADGTLWVVDDPTNGQLARIYHLTRTGGTIATVPAPTGGASSMQQIAVVPADGTLWVADNVADRLYHLSRTGTILSSITAGTFGSGFVNVQGVWVDGSNGSLWVTGRATHAIYNISTSGVNLMSPLDSVSLYGQANPTGIAVVPGTPPPPPPGGFNLGAAGPFTLLGLSATRVTMSSSSSGVTGDLGIGPSGDQNFSDGFITGTYYVDPTADNGKSNHVVISGGTVVQGLTQAVSDANAASASANGQAVTRTLGDIKSSMTVVAGPNPNVWSVGKIDLSGGKVLTLSGGPDTQIILNLSDKLSMSGGSAIKLAGGLQAKNVLFNLVNGKDMSLSGGSAVNGLVLDPGGKCTLSGGSAVTGKLICGGKEITLSGGSKVTGVS